VKGGREEGSKGRGEEGRKEGREEGRKGGREGGRKEGRKEGNVTLSILTIWNL